MTSRTQAFLFGQILDQDETRTCEFKEIKGSKPEDAIPSRCDDYAVGFLNSEGGKIYWGVRDADHAVVGVKLASVQRDQIRKSIGAKLHGIRPAIDPSRFKILFHVVKGSEASTFIVELNVPNIASNEPFYTESGRVFVRLDGVNKEVKDTALTDWIRRRLAPPVSVKIEPRKHLEDLTDRVRRLLTAHGLQPAQFPRFIAEAKAPFTISLTDLRDDDTFLAWLDDEKIRWLAQTFLVRREWIEGEDEGIHLRHYFDKNLRRFFETVSTHVDGMDPNIDRSPEAWFLRWGKGKDWKTKGHYRVFVIIRVPIVQLSSELTVFRYISDFEGYPVDYARTNIQLRAWARLLFVNKEIVCYGRTVSYEVGEQLGDNSLFLHELLEDHSRVQWCNPEWHPEDSALTPKESQVATDTDSLKYVFSFIKENNLPLIGWHK